KAAQETNPVKGAVNGAHFGSRNHFMFSCFRVCCFCFPAGGSKKRRAATSEDARRIAKGHEGRRGEEPRHRGGSGARFEWPIAVVRWIRESGPGSESRC